MDKYTWHAEPHMTEIDICRNENSGNEIIFVVERIDEAKQACKELNDLQHRLTQAYEVVTAQATRIQELEAENHELTKYSANLADAIRQHLIIWNHICDANRQENAVILATDTNKAMLDTLDKVVGNFSMVWVSDAFVPLQQVLDGKSSYYIKLYTEILNEQLKELETECEAYRAACDGMTPDGLHAWIKEVTADYAKLRLHSIRRASSGKIVDSVLEKVAMLEEQNTNLLTYIGSEPTTADDVNTGTVDVFAPIANGEVCAFCYHSFDDPCQNHPVCQTTGNPYPEHDTQPTIEPCPQCGGMREFSCDDCSGKGYTVGWSGNYADEPYQIPCYACGTTGNYECSYCEGRGEIETDELNAGKEPDTQSRYVVIHNRVYDNHLNLWKSYKGKWVQEKTGSCRYDKDSDAQDIADELNATPRVNGDGDGGAK